jgi:hypothetical protein
MSWCLVKHEDKCIFTLAYSVVREFMQKFPDWVDNEVYAYKNKHSSRSNTKCYGGRNQQTDSQNSDTIAPSGRELYHLQFLLQAASLETLDTPS